MKKKSVIVGEFGKKYFCGYCDICRMKKEIAKHNDLVLLVGEQLGPHIAECPGEVQYDGEEQRIFHLYPIKLGKVSYDDSRTEGMGDHNVLDSPAPRSGHKKAVKWFNEEAKDKLEQFFNQNTGKEFSVLTGGEKDYL